ncbi:response regulator [bacterium]|nr:MAG: response regulator [bacterium]
MLAEVVTETGNTVTPAGIQKILIIDDESSIRYILKEIITDLGYTAVPLEDIHDLEKEFEAWDYQLVLLDINMPDAYGVDVLKIIKEKFPLTMVMMVTGVLDMKTVIEAMKLGAVDYVTKPIDGDVLTLAVHRANEIYLLKKENQEYRDGLEKLVEKRTDQLYRFADALSKKNKLYMNANKDLQQANEKLQGFLNQAMVSDKISTLGLLSSMLIHGIANPLGVIAGITNVLQKRFPDEMTQNELNMMKQYIDQTLELVNQVRTFARTEVNQFASVNLAEVVKNAVTLIEMLNKKKQVSIVNRVTDARLVLQGNSSQLEQVLVNILQNSLDAMDKPGKIEIYIEESDPGQFKLIIQDSGSGMNTEHQQKIFKMFFTTKSGNKGTGLGLFICKEIMEKHGGSIQLESELNRGTKVTLSFKLDPAK